MGVQGLWSACLRQKDACVREVDLVQVAQDRNGIEILVDFYSFEQYFQEQFWLSICHYKQNDYLWVMGGEYASLDTYLRKVVTDLKSLGISLVFYMDGARGASTESTRQKLDTWIERHYRNVEKLNNMISVCRGVTPISDLKEIIRPVLDEEQFVYTLRQCGCEVQQEPAGEADSAIAKALHERENAYAVLSNDSDFCIFRDCSFIHHSLFDINHNLKLGSLSEIPEKPDHLIVGVITTDRVMSILGLSSYDQLVELSIVAGNDFTGHYMRGGLQRKLKMTGRGVEGVADWIRSFSSVESHQVLSQEMVIEKGIREGRYLSKIMGMHNNFFWHRAVVEDMGQGQPCSQIALAPLRAHIYRIILPRHESMVEEYGRSPWEPMRTAGVLAIEDDNIPSIHRIQPDKIFWNLRHFHYIMSHLEQRTGSERKWIERYGRKTGFTVYLLRYFLVLNWGRNLYLTDNEFLALLAMTMGHPNPSNYQGIHIRPTPRCVTVGNWFQDLYHHAYCYLGKLLNLTHEFPLPSDIFSGAVWTLFYTCCKDETFYAGAQQVPMDILKRTQFEMNRIIKEKRHMIRHICEDVFPFDDRY